MATYSYKCPNCAGPLTYKPAIGKLKCDFCQSEFTVEEIDKYIKENPDKRIAEDEAKAQSNKDISVKEDILGPAAGQSEGLDVDGEHVSTSGEDLKDFDQLSDSDQTIEEHIKGYNCDSCGAEVVTTDTTLTTFCYYCHNPVVITDRIQGNFKPNQVIPFKIDKKKAEEAFLSWAKSKKYVRKDFYSNSQLEKITGMYLPYWSTDTKYDLVLQGKGYTEKSYTSGDYRITDTSEYDINRRGNFIVNNVSELAYTKVDKTLLDSITPFKYEEVEPFKIFYLNGFFSETFDKSFEETKPALDSRRKDYVENVITQNLAQYSRYNLSNKEINILEEKKNYMLLPTWMMTYDYMGKKYIYALNGQTGKAFGDLPIDNKLIFRDAAIFGIVVFILVLLGGAFIW